MVRGKKKSSATAGFTLVELLVTVLLLMMIAAPIMGLFIASSRTTMASNDLTSASLTAQLCMEELVGRNKGELIDYLNERYNLNVNLDPVNPVYPPTPFSTPSRERNGFNVVVRVDRLQYEAPATYGETATIAYNQLAEVTVIVAKDGKNLCEQTNILNVA